MAKKNLPKPLCCMIRMPHTLFPLLEECEISSQTAEKFSKKYSNRTEYLLKSKCLARNAKDVVARTI